MKEIIIGTITKIGTREDGSKYATVEGFKSWDLNDKTPLVLDWALPEGAKVGDTIRIPRPA